MTGRLAGTVAAVYPRVCGGTTCTRKAKKGTKGLSPRVRGNHGRRLAPLDLPGSIPACAGEPLIGRQPAYCGGVYPRVCGGTG